MCGGGDAAGVVTAAGGDSRFDRSDPVVAGGAGDRLDGRPAQQPQRLLGDVPATGVGVGLTQPAVSPADQHCRQTSPRRCTSPISALATLAPANSITSTTPIRWLNPE
jgi:hypothetical protein